MHSFTLFTHSHSHTPINPVDFPQVRASQVESQHMVAEKHLVLVRTFCQSEKKDVTTLHKSMTLIQTPTYLTPT